MKGDRALTTNSHVSTLNSRIPKGYKQTEIGVIPEDWEVSTVGNEFSIQLGKMLDAEKNLGVLKPYLGNRAIQWGHIEVDNLGLIALTPSDIQRFRLQSGDLLICEGGEIGRAAIWINQLPECYYQKALHRLRPMRNYDINLMLSMLQYWANKNFLNNFVTQTSIAHLPKEKFVQVPLLVPPIAEQNLIARALSDTDTLIESLEQLLAKKRQIKQGAMQELLLGKRRLLRLGEGKGYKQTELGLIPEDWAFSKFTDATSLITCGIAATPQYVDESQGYPFLSSSNIKSGKIVWSNFKYVTIQLHKQLYRNNPPKRGDILYSRVGTIGEAAVIEVDFEFSVYVSLTLIKPNQTIDSYFLMHLLNSASYKQRAQDQVYLGGGVGNLNVDVVRNYPIFVPPLLEQQAIATILSDMDLEIGAIETKLTKARQLKQGMMHELLTGKIRLIDKGEAHDP